MNVISFVLYMQATKQALHIEYKSSAVVMFVG